MLAAVCKNIGNPYNIIICLVASGGEANLSSFWPIRRIARPIVQRHVHVCGSSTMENFHVMYQMFVTLLYRWPELKNVMSVISKNIRYSLILSVLLTC